MISKLEKQNKIIKYINLDIGIGTFKPIDTKFIEDHKVHNENYFIKKNDYKEILKLKEDGYKIYAVGTTVLRTLETVVNTKNYKGSTDLYIKPGYQYKLVDYLITNFHAPNSSLLSIVLSIVDKFIIQVEAQLEDKGVSLSIDKKAKELEKDLNSIFEFIEALNKVDTKKVDPLTSIAETSLKLRGDEVKTKNIREQILKNSPDENKDFFVVPKVVE